MDKQNALKLLGLGDAASADEIQAALKAKKQDIADKKANAPTEALKAKFESLEAKLAEAEKVLSADPGKSEPVGDNSTGSEETKQTGPSPLSQTKLADLPGLAPHDAAQVELQPGQIIADRYEIKELIGQGGMGAVYRAFDKNRDEDIAIKVLLPSLTKNERALERFLNEARISSKLSHQNIVNVFDVQRSPQVDGAGDFYFLIMELLEGQDLAQLIQTREQLNQPFTAKELVEVIEQLAPALDYAHQHTVHRDIKPENVWLDEDGYYKLMDFGIAQLQSTSQRTQTGAAMGTAYYMAPEQLKGSKNVDARADIYALGVMLYAMATGDVPAGLIKPLHEKRPDISPAFSNAVMQCLEADPTDRPQSANDLLTLLQQGLAAKGRKIKKGATSKSPRPTSAGHLHGGGSNKLVIAAVLLLIVGVGGVVGTGMLDLSGLLPMSKEERRALQGDAVRLQGQVDTLVRRLESERRNLDSDLREAERNDSEDLVRLQRWSEAVERNLFGGSLMSDLAGERAVAGALLRDKEYEPAAASLEKVRDGYEQLLAEFRAAESLYDAQQAVADLDQAWNRRQDQYGLKSPLQIDQSRNREKEAVRQERAGELVEALESWREAERLLRTAVKATDQKVASIDAKRVEARRQEQQRQAREERELKQRFADMRSTIVDFMNTIGSTPRVRVDIEDDDLYFEASNEISVENKEICELDIYSKSIALGFVKILDSDDPFSEHRISSTGRLDIGKLQKVEVRQLGPYMLNERFSGISFFINSDVNESLKLDSYERQHKSSDRDSYRISILKVFHDRGSIPEKTVSFLEKGFDAWIQYCRQN